MLEVERLVEVECEVLEVLTDVLDEVELVDKLELVDDVEREVEELVEEVLIELEVLDVDVL